MPPPSYPHRHLLLTNLLDEQSACTGKHAFKVKNDVTPKQLQLDPLNEIRSVKLDTLLLSGWAVSRSLGKEADRDVLHHADNLRLKRTDFDVLGRVGEGQFGSVDAVRCRLDGKVYAMKTIEKTMVLRAGSQLSLPVERHLHLLSHRSAQFSFSTPPIPQLVTAFQSPTSLHLVTTYAACGSLWDRLCEVSPEADFGTLRDTSMQDEGTGRLEEREVLWWAAQMVSAIQWVHSMGFCHRDVKPHNFLLLPNARLLLTDFGSSVPLVNLPGTSPSSSRPASILKHYCALPAGTPDYVAPEILSFAEEAITNAAQSAFGDEEDGDRTIRPSFMEGDRNVEMGYDASVDWWSLGVTLYEMAVGKAPFWAPSIGETYSKITRCEHSLRFPASPMLTDEFKQLMRGLLVPAARRIARNGCWEIHSHPIFEGVEWNSVGKTRPPSWLSSPDAIDLATLAVSFHQPSSFKTEDSTNDITFDHFFEKSSPGLTSKTIPAALETDPQGQPVCNHPPWERWVGWSWDPPPDFFGHETPSPLAPQPPLAALPHRARSVPLPRDLMTPLRPSHLASTTPGIFRSGSIPRTAPRTVARTRPVSERQGFRELLVCVQQSARKKAAKNGDSISSLGSNGEVALLNGRWGDVKEVPPTPTPRSRDVTTNTSQTASLTSVASKRKIVPKSSKVIQSRIPGSRPRLHGEDSPPVRLEGRSLEALETWHQSLENGLDGLEHRLAKLVADLGRDS
ncbi:hypothetical protein P7C73_g1440, partial [Tremellales sp. Uapishka_1]